jgi:TonB family protein
VAAAEKKSEDQMMRCANCGRELAGGVRFCPACGTPAASAGYSAPAAGPVGSFGDATRPPLSGVGQPRKKSGCAKALIILLVVGVLVLIGLGVAGYFGYRFAEGKLKSSEAYTLAVSALKSDAEVAQKMGEITETGFPIGSFSENADGSGVAAYRMSVEGTKASGNYDVAMTRRGGKWGMRMGRVTLAGGEVINLAPSLADDAPPPPVIGEGPPTPPPAGAGKAGAGTVISAGVLNGKATSKPEPSYPAIARAARASGTVTVQVVVDEQGKVTSAKAVSGHPLLRASAEAAARQARFSPTVLSGRPVKVSGVVTYNFTAPE